MKRGRDAQRQPRAKCSSEYRIEAQPGDTYTGSAHARMYRSNSPGYAYNTPAMTLDSLVAQYGNKPMESKPASDTKRDKSPEYTFYTQVQPCGWIVPSYQPRLGERCCSGAHCTSVHGEPLPAVGTPLNLRAEVHSEDLTTTL